MAQSRGKGLVLGRIGERTAMWEVTFSTIYSYIIPLIEILVLAVVYYRFYLMVAQTRAVDIVYTAIVVLAFFAICLVLKLDMLVWCFKKMFLPLCMFLIILYQAELRRMFTGFTAKKITRLFKMNSPATEGDIDTVLNACNVLSEKKRGALIVFPQSVGLKPIIDTGTKLNADLSSSLILTIFDHDTPLHDGATIISKGKIVAAGCYLPLSEQSDIKKSFGTRHRAALGLTEESDALVIIVSEETRAISLAYNSNIYYDLDNAQLKKMFIQAQQNQGVINDKKN